MVSEFFSPFVKLLAVATSRRFISRIGAQTIALFGLAYALWPTVEKLLDTVYNQEGEAQVISIVTTLIVGAALIGKVVGQYDEASKWLSEEYKIRPPKLSDIKLTAEEIMESVDTAKLNQTEQDLKDLANKVQGLAILTGALAKKDDLKK